VKNRALVGAEGISTDEGIFRKEVGIHIGLSPMTQREMGTIRTLSGFLYKENESFVKVKESDLFFPFSPPSPVMWANVNYLLNWKNLRFGVS